MNETKQKAGRLGGQRTVETHGRQHMSEIGRRGAVELWRRYQLQPVGLSGWMLIDRVTGQVKAKW